MPSSVSPLARYFSAACRRRFHDCCCAAPSAATRNSGAASEERPAFTSAFARRVSRIARAIDLADLPRERLPVELRRLREREPLGGAVARQRRLVGGSREIARAVEMAREQRGRRAAAPLHRLGERAVMPAPLGFAEPFEHALANAIVVGLDERIGPGRDDTQQRLVPQLVDARTGAFHGAGRIERDAALERRSGDADEFENPARFGWQRRDALADDVGETRRFESCEQRTIRRRARGATGPARRSGTAIRPRAPRPPLRREQVLGAPRRAGRERACARHPDRAAPA